ncbi:DUF6538 domain-containing protein [Pseudemcibacter aquimaris]|uniref:DUF6538 domain-containing protein n=1 Tax=Pseudemcibacter aquimaris TaxID=2857064 RepID=UPI00201212CF|nr:DUF6538 domain-containing protein [Pseudemcibacter aquimaris]MCC3861492.1 hypothetical protein [Pseudemcibacter aquimaris]WDU58261.1 hypothetical protein KW060_13805 [Pseudemcibacter aquimaris]
MRQNRHPHLYNRNGQYYFRYRFNKEASTALFRQEIWKSLNTSDIDKAAEKCLRLSRNAKSLEQMVGAMDHNKELSKEIVDDLIQVYFQEEYEQREVLLGLDMSVPNFDIDHELSDEQKIKMSMPKK